MKLLRLGVCILVLAPFAYAQHDLSVGAGYSYTHSDVGESNAKLHGWYLQSSMFFTNHISLVVETDTYYGNFGGGSMNQHNYVIGPRYTFRSPQARIRPLVYAQAGDERTSTVSEIVNGYNLQLGGGLAVKMSRRVSLNVIPVEYSYMHTYEDERSSYAAKVGLNFTVWRKKK